MTKLDYNLQETLLKVENVNLAIGGFQILKDVNVEVRNIVRPGFEQGQVIGFLGPSGVGKTKFSEVLSGIISPESSRTNKNIELSGQVLLGVDQKPTKIGRVGVVQQSYPLLEHANVFRNFQLVARNRYKDKEEADNKVQNMLEMLNLQKHTKYYPSNLSGGQRQRVAIGQALLNCEDFIIFDEPFSGLDINMISRVLEMIRTLTDHNELLTVIIISHDITATTAISDTLWLMGKDKNPETGEFIPGASIKKQIDLMERGLAWTPNITLRPEFSDTTREIRAIFPELG